MSPSPSDRTPLLSEEPRRRPSNAVDGDDETGYDPDPSPPPGPFRLRETLLFIWALLATAGVIVLAVWSQHSRQTRHEPSAPEKRNLIFMVSDGMGPASLSLTRSFRQHIHDLPHNDTLTLDQNFWGTSRTRSSNSLVTDSAAGATAFSCGKKSYNSAISVTPDYEPCGTVLEAAKRAGYKTGLVVTTDITDATPACFASHVLTRSMNDDIALQEVGDGPLGRVVDLMLGGGRCHFLPNGTDDSCRLDDTDVVSIAQSQFNWTYASDRAGFDDLDGGENVNMPFLGLFAHYNVPFEIDRRHMNHIYPSLTEMTRTALRALEKATEDSDQGFFLMIEGSRIDHAGHINDPAAQVHEVLEYDNAFEIVLEFIEKSDTETILVATSDHETGGLSTALQEPGQWPVYDWFPKALAQANSSAEYLALRLAKHVVEAPSESKKDLKKWINKNLVIAGLGITDALDEELEALAEAPLDGTYIFAAMISLRAHVGWSTHGHSAVDVNIYSSGGRGVDKIRGNMENTDIGNFLHEWLDVDVGAITKELKAKADRAKHLGADRLLKEDLAAQVAGSVEGPDHWMEQQRMLNGQRWYGNGEW
ncbi:repressible alkaline phosphatase [Sodiomyces alkalinus F11]|uniref:Alkaline phosphatase n=1 Tax=Sodiomyces alkalinus (strain CBS 110278 / VKM F-3762 / F11) TaxID=1314773 RepID=A0A3N2Q5L0_SODAK|nr:repressible alkaline phosphatase [Sodiomyces alkalinus F11]ROT42061.1 repressible alkaline phosphatase [Sodiomyces alkalinus F11]